MTGHLNKIMKKIPKRLFGQFVKDTSVDASTFSYRQSLENIKAGSFSLVCENSARSVVKLTVCPVFSTYIEQIQEIVPSQSVIVPKQLAFQGGVSFPVKAYILPKMEQITGEEVFFKRMLSLCDKLKDIGNVLKILNIFLTVSEDNWTAAIKTKILEKYSYVSWHPSIRIESVEHISGKSMSVKFSGYSQKMALLATKLQEEFDTLSLEEKKILLKKIRISTFCYTWIEKFNKSMLLGDFPKTQVELMVQCFKAAQNTMKNMKSVVFDFHKGNLMVSQYGAYKGLMVLTDPLFDSSLLSLVRESDSCSIT